MPVALRFSRAGAKKRPYYRLVATDSRNARDGGNFLERLGSFNPLLAKDDPKRFTFNEERVKYWISVGGKASEKVEKLLANAGIIKLKTDYSKKPKKAVKNPGKFGGNETPAAAPAEATAAPAEKPAEEAAPAEAPADQAPGS